MTIKTEWLTSAERSVLREALDFYDKELQRRALRTQNDRVRASTAWRSFVAKELARDIAE